MMTATFLRVGALAALLSVIGQVTSVILAPDWDGPPEVGASAVLAAADIWMVFWLIHLAGILFAVPAMTVVLRALDGTEGDEWARLCLPLVIVAATLGCAETLTGGSLFALAAASDASPAAQAGYLAAFDAMRGTTVFIDFGAIVALGMLLLAFATAILVSRVYARAIGWLCAGAGVLVLVGILVELAASEAGLMVFAGNVVFQIALIALAVSMWRRAARVGDAAATVAPSGLDPATAAH